jgi:hypothetical protein
MNLNELLAKLPDPPEWFNQLIQECQSKNMAVTPGNNGRLYILCSKEPAKDTQARVRDIIPLDIPYEFKAQPMKSTIESLQALIQRSGAIRVDSEMHKIPHHLDMDVQGMGPELEEKFSQTWNLVLDTLSKDEYFDSWVLKCNGITMHIFNRKIAQELEHNIKRADCIQEDDITNLHIDLGRINTIDELIASL